MCEFCPIIGRCSICEHYAQPQLVGKPPAHPQEDRSGYVVTHQGVAVRFNRHSDAMACLRMFPTATVS